MRMSLSTFARTDQPLPCEVKPGRTFRAMIDEAFLAFLLKTHGFPKVRVEGYFNDELGTHWRESKTLVIDLLQRCDNY